MTSIRYVCKKPIYQLKPFNVITSTEIDINVGDVLEYYGTWGNGTHEFRTSCGIGVLIKTEDFEECLERVIRTKEEVYEEFSDLLEDILAIEEKIIELRQEIEQILSENE